MRILIRADAGDRIGYGHMMRCLALATELSRRGHTVDFAAVESAAQLIPRLEEGAFELHVVSAERGSREDARRTIDLAQDLGCRWVILDGYCFDSRYQQAVAEAGLQCLVIDDDGRHKRYDTDLLLNTTVEDGADLYRESSYGRLMVGAHFALLRPDIRAAQERAHPPNVEHPGILITLGGAAHCDVLQLLVEGVKLARVDWRELVVIAGSCDTATIRECVGTTAFPVRVEAHVDHLEEEMLRADIALSGAGGTCRELAALGVPMLLVQLAENQRHLARSMTARGAAELFGRPDALTTDHVAERLTILAGDQELMLRRSKAGMEMVDGNGVERVADALEQATVELRPAMEEDAKLLWRWANDPEVRQQAYQGESISWRSHLRWFDAKLRDPNCTILLAWSPQDRPMGQVRFDIRPDGWAEVDVSVDSNIRSAGLGTILLRCASRLILRDERVNGVEAWVKSGNGKSRRAFEKAGFRADGEHTVHGIPSIRYLYDGRTEPATLSPVEGTIL
ncbi:UDP-2,4-diacetamido-2,4,6-trideoxy-beta-L-altropyranose hydrolase [bacterium]|nr:UDP-2,4-diacetamido-2,4,6-trideoxy-beta-L-altropyranose hydrolase [bacterium]